MVFVSVQNQILSAGAIVRKANKKQSTSKQFKVGVLFFLFFFLTDFQSKETAQKSTNPRVNQLMVLTPLNLMSCLPLMYFVTRQRTVEDGLCSRRDWTARLISTATGTTTNVALVTWIVNFGWDWTRFTAWPHIITTRYVWIWKRGWLIISALVSSRACT